MLSSESESDASDNDAEEDGESTSTTASAFFNRWSPAIDSCSSREELDRVTESCAAEWHLLTLKADKATENGRQGSRERVTGTHAAPRRQQSRQQQRIRRKDNTKKREEASRIQSLFKRFPKRAVWKVLGETSQAYTGTVEAATEFLKAAYEQPRPSATAVLEARRVYDGCGWANPSVEELEYLASPPTKIEIARKLKRASNIAPGADGVEYKDISRLDPECRLLEVLYAAVWRLGVPRSWKSARTIPIFKKGSTDDYGNFRPISLLSTLYKLFSGCIASRITTVASDNKWLSQEQKGFLPGVHGIQEHTMLLEAAIEEARSQKGSVTICWLDLANAFGSLPHDYLNQVFCSLPLPHVLRSLLTDIYRDNEFHFVVG